MKWIINWCQVCGLCIKQVTGKPLFSSGFGKVWPRRRIRPLPGFENKVLLEHSHLPSLRSRLWPLSPCVGRVLLLRQLPASCRLALPRESVMASGLRLPEGSQERQRRLEALGCPVLLREGEGGRGGASLIGMEEEAERSRGEQREVCAQGPAGRTQPRRLQSPLHGFTERGASVQQKLEKPESQLPLHRGWLRAGARHRPPADSLLPWRPLHLSPAGFSASRSSCHRSLCPRMTQQHPIATSRLSLFKEINAKIRMGVGGGLGERRCRGSESPVRGEETVSISPARSL